MAGKRRRYQSKSESDLIDTLRGLRSPKVKDQVEARAQLIRFFQRRPSSDCAPDTRRDAVIYAAEHVDEELNKMVAKRAKTRATRQLSSLFKEAVQWAGGLGQRRASELDGGEMDGGDMGRGGSGGMGLAIGNGGCSDSGSAGAEFSNVVLPPPRPPQRALTRAARQARIMRLA